jgi:hypothetical protein
MAFCPIEANMWTMQQDALGSELQQYSGEDSIPIAYRLR